MLPSGSRLVRLARAVFVGLWVVAGAVLAHAVPVGGAPPVVALVPVAVAASTVAWFAASRRLTFPVVLALLGGSQLAVHLLSSYVHGHAMAPSPLMGLAHLGALAVVAAGIAKADDLWWTWWHRATLVVRLVVRTVAVVTAAPVPSTARPRDHGAVLAHVVVRRGPPAA